MAQLMAFVALALCCFLLPFGKAQIDIRNDSGTYDLCFQSAQTSVLRHPVINPLESSWNWGLAHVGDLDGDSYPDVALGGTPYSSTEIRLLFLDAEGRVSDVNPTARIEFVNLDPSVSSTLGAYNLDAIDDLDNDGNVELVVGDYYNGGIGGYGTVYILYLSNSDPWYHAWDRIDATYGILPFAPGGTNNFFGYSFASLGDVDQDGIPDLFIGEHKYNRGYVILLQSSTTHQSDGLSPSNGLIVKSAVRISEDDVSGLSATQEVGISSAGPGDFDGDSFVDVIVGMGQASEALIFFALDGGGDVLSFQILTSIHPGSNSDFGGYVRVLPDLDGNGVKELLVSNIKAFELTPPEQVILMYMDSDFSVKYTRPFLEMYSTLPLNGAEVAYCGGWPSVCPPHVIFDTLDDFDNDGIVEVIIHVLERDTTEDLASSDNGMYDALWVLPVFHCNCTDTGGVGDTCENFCQNGGWSYDGLTCTCDNAIGAYCQTNCDPGIEVGGVCDCGVTGYEGVDCSTNVDDCASNPCQHGGTCIDDNTTVYAYNCTCVDYLGENCEILPDLCASSPCLNDGTCVQTELVVTCTDCAAGYEGELCEIEIDECTSNPCMQGGVCSDLVTDYECDCTDTGYEGKQCATEVDDCSSSPCLNGAICTDDFMDFSCECAQGYKGKYCTNDVDDCVSAPCLNGATCVDAGAASFVCLCADTYVGSTCETLYDLCLSSPCMHDGLCVFKPSKYTYNCECDDVPYEGDFCEIPSVPSVCDSSPCSNNAPCSDAAVLDSSSASSETAAATCDCDAIENEFEVFFGLLCERRCDKQVDLCDVTPMSASINMVLPVSGMATTNELIDGISRYVSGLAGDDVADTQIRVVSIWAFDEDGTAELVYSEEDPSVEPADGDTLLTEDTEYHITMLVMPLPLELQTASNTPEAVFSYLEVAAEDDTNMIVRPSATDEESAEDVRPILLQDGAEGEDQVIEEADDQDDGSVLLIALIAVGGAVLLAGSYFWYSRNSAKTGTTTRDITNYRMPV